MSTPYFPAWRRTLAAYGRRTTKRRWQSAVEIQSQCSRFLPREVLAAPQSGSGSRRRVFDRSRTFWLFLWQVLQPGTSCRAVVRQVQAFCETDDLRIDESSSAYCQARARLPFACMQQALQESARAADRFAGREMPGWTRPIKVVDGTSVQLPDTDENRALYPYPSGQKPGCGFPVMGVLGIQSLNSGAMLQAIQATWSAHDFRLFHSAWEHFEPGDIVMGDRAFCAYAGMALLPLRGVDMVARLHQARTFDLRQAKRIGEADWLVTWKKPPRHKGQVITPEEWTQMPPEITIRIIHSRMNIKGFRTKEIWIATTLLDPEAYPAEEIAALYLRRWDLELCFRDLKTTMGMEHLRCRTPEMVRKELFAYLVAHNFIRCLIAQAAAAHDLPRTRISFKGTIDAARSFHQAIRFTRSAKKASHLRNRLLEIIARDAVPLRPNRSEPRAVKRRPKNYQRLTSPRHSFREIAHRTRHKVSS